MDALRMSAAARFQHQIFTASPGRYDVLTITSGEGQSPRLSNVSIPVGDVKQIAENAGPGSLILAQVMFAMQNSRAAFHSNQEDILNLWEMFQLEPYTIGMISTDMTGFHHFGGDKVRPATYYLQCAAYKFAWAYDPRTRSTRGVAFILSTRRGRQAFADWASTLPPMLDLAPHPMFIALSGAIQALDFMDRLLREQYSQCRTTESATGVHPWQSAMGGTEELIKFSELQRTMSGLLIETEMIIRRVKQWRMAMDMLKASPEDDPTAFDDAYSQTSMARISTSAHIIEGQLKVMEIDFNYVHARAENQLTTIVQMMTRDEAFASIELARAAVLDSSSMKVIAIMTMVFLPGTFFAALFSVPSLRWDTRPVIQDNFWVYWAFTLPFTALVLLIWAGWSAWKTKTSAPRDGLTTDSGNNSKRGPSESTKRPSTLSEKPGGGQLPKFVQLPFSKV